MLGYGSQGHAHALSLRDSGVDVRVGLPEGRRAARAAEAEGLRVATPEEACDEADLIMVLAPDPVQRDLYAEAIAPNLEDGDALFFGARAEHPLRPDQPAGRASMSAWSRRRVPDTWSAASSPTAGACRCWSRSSRTRPARPWPLALSYAKGIGGTRAGALKTTFTEETETDLFGEQVVLCGGLPS